eukprot:m.659459 g.659459  ORF g.659459 m.659459 type:complete len:133 (+) comp22723_c0_seq9:149-547(+)
MAKFRLQGISVSPEFLCTQNTFDNGGNRRDSDGATMQNLLNTWICTDIAETHPVAVLPRDGNTAQEKFELTRNVVLQIDAVLNVAESAYSQHDRHKAQQKRLEALQREQSRPQTHGNIADSVGGDPSFGARG